jgi:hypothetical protein
MFGWKETALHSHWILGILVRFQNHGFVVGCFFEYGLSKERTRMVTQSPSDSVKSVQCLSPAYTVILGRDLTFTGFQGRLNEKPRHASTQDRVVFFSDILCCYVVATMLVSPCTTSATSFFIDFLIYLVRDKAIDRTKKKKKKSDVRRACVHVRVETKNCTITTSCRHNIQRHHFRLACLKSTSPILYFCSLPRHLF